MNAVTARRLQPLYSACESRNYKQALAIADRLLKKDSGLACVKVLKALSLVALGKEKEGWSLLEPVIEQPMLDLTTLRTVLHVLNELKKYRALAGVLQKNLVYVTGAEELWTLLFTTYVRLEDFLLQKQTAIKMFKLFNNENYYIWAVQCLLLQCKFDEKLEDTTIHLSLAERMLEKAEHNGWIKSEDVLDLALEAFILINKPLSAAALLERNSHLFSDDVRKWRILARLNADAQCWEVHDNYQQKILSKFPDDCVSYLEYIRSVFRGDCFNVDRCRDVWQFLSVTTAQYEGEKSMLRGPRFARLFFVFSCLDSGYNELSEVLDLPSLEFLLVDYFAKFGDKLVCSTDLGIILPSICPSLLLSFFDSLQSAYDNFDKLDSSSNLARHASFQRLKRRSGLMDAETCESLVALSESLLTSNLTHARDDLLGFSAELLLSAFLKSGCVKHLHHAALLLRCALNKSPYDARLKVRLLLVYNQLGMFASAFSLFSSLDVKQIQVETLSYLVDDIHVACGDLERRMHHFGLCSSFYCSAGGEIAEAVVKAFRFGTFSKISELTAFKQKINASLAKLFYSVELAFSKCFGATHKQAFSYLSAIIVLNPCFESLQDNRDFEILKHHSDPEAQSLKQQHTERAKHCRAHWIQHRILLAQLLCCSFFYEKKPELLSSYKNHLSFCTSTFGSAVLGEFDGYSFLYSHFKDYKPFGLLYESLLLCASAFFSAVQVEHQNAQAVSAVKSALTALLRSTKGCLGSVPFSSVDAHFFRVLNFVFEMFAFQSLVLQSFTRSKLTRKQKKELPILSVLQAVADHLRDLRECLEAFIQRISALPINNHKAVYDLLPEESRLFSTQLADDLKQNFTFYIKLLYDVKKNLESKQFL
ncbi:N-alpha-acetyltransferase 25, NatB auxiliary subunit-like [Zophobas morio]|uniref:N-alpha-acetyltransferase 25, NatB auxiliary subunit-like n=1 Tax=Zophobas morio TaxID=2755281 RepID=UPI00308320E5